MRRNKNRNQKGMAMVEYGLGLACVAFTAVVALSYLGYDIADIIEDVLENTTLGNEHKPPEPVPFVTKNILGT